MRIGVISDTHGNTNVIDQAVEMAGAVDVWLHAGDFIADADYLRTVYEAEVVNVAGNCDGFAQEASEEIVYEAEGCRIFLTHGHLYDVKRNPHRLVIAAREKNASIAVFGHSHVAFINKINDVLLINPGSLAYPRDGKGRSFVVLELDLGREPEIYHYHLQT